MSLSGAVRPSVTLSQILDRGTDPAVRFAMSQSTTILFFLMTSPQRCASAWMKAAISAGLLPIGSTLAVRNLACTSGALITSTAALAISAVNAGAVFGGAASANPPGGPKPGKPASAVVGTSGSTGERRVIGNRQDLHPAIAEGRAARRDVPEEDVDVAADHVVEHQRFAAIGHVHHLRVGHALKHHGGEMGRGA